MRDEVALRSLHESSCDWPPLRSVPLMSMCLRMLA